MATQDTLSKLGCLLRIVLVGGEKVGCKTLINQFMHQSLASPPFSYKESDVTIDGVRVRLILFHWRQLSSASSLMNLETWGKMLQAAVFVFSLADHASLNKMEKYLIQLSHFPSRAKVIIANKMDLLSEKASPILIEGQELAAKYSLPFYLTNALTGENVEQAFITLAAEALVNVNKEMLPSLYLNPKVISPSNESEVGPPDDTGGTISLTEERDVSSRTHCCNSF